MKKTLVLLSLVLFTTFGFLEKPKAQMINPDHPALRICAVLSNPAGSIFMWPTLWPSIQAIPFPPFIAPGLVTGLSQGTSIVTYVCNVLTQVAQFGTQEGIHGIRGVGNALTGNRWDSHLDQVDLTWKIANTVYDFDNGTFRKGALESESAHRDMRDFMKESYGWYQTTFNQSDARIKNRTEQENELQQFSNLVHRRAILAEATNCPDPSGNPNYDKIHDIEIKPLQRKIDEADVDMDFYKTKLIEMGVRFSNNQEDYAKYINGVEKLVTQGVNYQISYKPKTETKKVPNPSRKDKNGKPILMDKTMTIQTQVWTARVFSDVFQDFKKNYYERWANYVTQAFVASDSRGMLVTNPQERVEAEFKDFAYECNPGKLMSAVSVDRPDYEKIYEERTTKCREDVKMNQKKAENLLDYYVNQLQISTLAYKKAKGELWTKESWYLGTMRSVNTRDKTDGFQQQEVACAEGNELTPAEMDQIARKQQSVTTELKEVIAKQQTKKTIHMEEKAKAASQTMKTLNTKNDLENRKNASQADAMKKSSAASSFTIDGGIDDGSGPR